MDVHVQGQFTVCNTSNLETIVSISVLGKINRTLSFKGILR